MKRVLSLTLLAFALSACRVFDADEDAPAAPATTGSAAASQIQNNTSETALPVDVEMAAQSDSDSSETGVPVDVI